MHTIVPATRILEAAAVLTTLLAAPPLQAQTPSFFGHHIGLSSGDPALMDISLEASMVFTVEPWYYNHDIDIAVFVEDVILVTEDGAEVLTSALPRTPEELEAMIR